MTGILESDRQSFLYRFSRSVSQQNHAEHVLQCLVIHAQHYYQADAASLVWFEADGTQVFRAIQGTLSEHLIGLRFPQGEGISGWVAEKGECVWIPDVTQHKRFFAEVDASTGFTTHAILAAPMVKADKVVAVIEIINPGIPIDHNQAKETLQALTMMTVQAYDQQLEIANKQRFADIFQSHNDPCIVVAHNGHVMDVNQAARIVFHIAPEDDLHLHFDALKLANTNFIELIQALPDKGVSRWDLMLGNGETRTYQATLAQIGESSPPVYSLQAHDVTEYIAMENSRLQLFNMLVHDLRVPLGSIRHSIELVMTAWNEKDTTIPVNQVLEIALRSEQRMERLISDILDTSRLNSQTKSLNITDINLYDLAQETAHLVATSANRRNQTLSLDVQPELRPLSGDLDLIQRVLINILGNAVKYTPDGGKIDFNIYDDTQYVYFKISDNGPGILPADEAHIFELFFRGHTNRIKGAGIGLAFSKLAVEAHGGKIWLEHNTPQGAIFVFAIPKVLPDSAIFFEEHQT